MLRIPSLGRSCGGLLGGIRILECRVEGAFRNGGGVFFFATSVEREELSPTPLRVRLYLP